MNMYFSVYVIVCLSPLQVHSSWLTVQLFEFFIVWHEFWLSHLESFASLVKSTVQCTCPPDAILLFPFNVTIILLIFYHFRWYYHNHYIFINTILIDAENLVDFDKNANVWFNIEVAIPDDANLFLFLNRKWKDKKVWVYIYIYIYIYMCVCVCVCVCVDVNTINESDNIEKNWKTK